MHGQLVSIIVTPASRGQLSSQISGDKTPPNLVGELHVADKLVTLLLPASGVLRFEVWWL